MTQLMLNIGSPRLAARAAATDAAGVGLMRAEFLFYSLGKHPLSFVAQDGDEKLLEILKSGMRDVAGAFGERPVRYRTLDFKSNEMRSLIDGPEHEAVESNPALGLRGCSRYRRDRDVLMIELRALAELWDEGLTNLQVMFPFVRGAEELEFCRAALDEAGAGSDLPVWAMLEVPAMFFMIDEIAPHVDGVSVGTNDLAQLMLGVDRDNADVAYLYDDGHPAVVDCVCAMLAQARDLGLGTSVCGDRPSRDAGFVRRLLAERIDSISVPMDALDETRIALGEAVSNGS